MHRTIFALAATAIGLASFSLPAVAADPGYCHHYADLAVWQFHRNLAIPGCFHGPDARWNANWSGHYGWCLGAPWEAARAEDARRGERLHECSFAAFGHP